MTTFSRITLTLGIIGAIATPFAAWAADKAPEADKVKVADCVDGKAYYSSSNAHQGACARHGGVAAWADGSPVKVRAAKKGE